MLKPVYGARNMVNWHYMGFSSYLSGKYCLLLKTFLTAEQVFSTSGIYARWQIELSEALIKHIIIIIIITIITSHHWREWQTVILMSYFLGCDATSLGIWFPTFRGSVVASGYRVDRCKKATLSRNVWNQRPSHASVASHKNWYLIHTAAQTCKTSSVHSTYKGNIEGVRATMVAEEKQ
jgi:hypothetical protein